MKRRTLALFMAILLVMGGGLAATAEKTVVEGGATTPSEALTRYLTAWQYNDYDAMVLYAKPQWVDAQEHNQQQLAQQQLYWNHNWWHPVDWTLGALEMGSERPRAVFYPVTVDVEKQNSERTRVSMAYYAGVYEVEGYWYVDPETMREGTLVTPDNATESLQQEATAALETYMLEHLPSIESGSMIHAITPVFTTDVFSVFTVVWEVDSDMNEAPMVLLNNVVMRRVEDAWQVDVISLENIVPVDVPEGSIGIIGGADGPTAIFIAAHEKDLPEEEKAPEDD